MERFTPELGPRHTDLAEAQKDIDHLHAALTSQPMIEQAKGILMADERIDEDEAFKRLAKLSQTANLKLRDVARRLVDDRTRPVG